MTDQKNPPEEDLTSTPAEAGSEAPQEPIHWATKGQRVAAWIAAIAVIIITLAYAYSIATGALFSR